MSLGLELQDRYFLRHQSLLAVVPASNFTEFLRRAREFDGLIEAAQWQALAMLRARAPRARLGFGGQEAGQSEAPIGEGAAREIKALARELDATAVVVDVDLEPTEQKKLEKIIGLPVLDRSALVLAIFAFRAQTREGKLQVEVAQLKYLAPRLTRMWTHLGRVGGGTKGMRGEGETQMEQDKRRIRNRLHQLESELKQVALHRGRLRSGRIRAGLPQVTLVGYTNAGKSTLLEALAGESGLSKDALFATLEPRTRRVHAPGVGDYFLADTVGFIERLSPELVAAFHATLEIAASSDLILVVLDASHPDVVLHCQVALDVLISIGAQGIPVLYCLNKIDRAETLPALPEIPEIPCHGTLPISAMTGAGFGQLQQAIARVLRATRVFVRVRIGADQAQKRAQFYRESIGTQEQWDGDQCILSGYMSQESAAAFSPSD